ncbi:hypothetical protein THAOC_04983 [Thalassiosira oceanica]|uniref:Uncharacterized protein n=1 Tax=Thalassiosira oceanica TaxID=159749 RepID=K0TI04_THAOC|nr:hypothetical protein THAOC_04983 [Thalassiosira oceanica]|eukprot:EJK73391.1 hypothetical protein THAOC_04983 [Thalassiosira oceanica]
MSAEEVQEPRKRRRRKDGKQFDSLAPSTPPAPPTPKERVVVMQVRDINAVVSGAPEEEVVEADTKKESVVDDDVLADDEEWEYYDVDDDGNELFDNVDEFQGRTTDDSLEQLLADARSMRTRTSDEASPLKEEETPSSIKDTVFEVVSTIVTIDFFVVIGLLVWFIAGIFCSSVLGNDTVQIAFNMNFEKVTQPALGILMIGSIAGAVGNNDGDSNENER